MYLHNKYTIWYNSIISRALTRSLDKSCYFEKHHIVPRCLGGTNDKNNIVKLTAREHFICHLLLVRMVDDRVAKSKLSYAVWQVTKRYTVSSKMYEMLRIQLSANTKGIPKSEAHKEALRKPKSNTANMKGGPGAVKGRKISEKGLENIRAAAKRRDLSGNKNPFYGKAHTEEMKQHYRNLFTGQKLSDEHRQKISQGLKGKSTWNKGIPASIEHRNNVSKSLIGDIYITDGINNKRIKPVEFINYDQTVWRRGKVRKNI
jgi:hypothetical protein